ncbi:proline dehydrogenase family protein [Terrabacter sp. MAHUQ-38]|uniref:proline dehydrogenase family protein n=1 Tax=unclassified Terrabacter TaxID=2630222 RepID=UPI00165E82D4|nr:proline dehydrogenase family protein [Terrabacter sp. MAHUQ-38]MBC9822180.1 proline dehydrogenase family protein [Terrabacter sp. MAHUQ-38]
MLGSTLLTASRSPRVRRLVTSAPGSRPLVERFVVGETTAEALDATRVLTGSGLAVTLDHLGEDTLDVAQARATRQVYVTLLGGLAELGLADRAEVSLKLSAVGQALPRDGHDLALENARAVAAAAEQAGTTVTLDMEDHTTVDSTLAILRELRVDFPGTGAVLQSCLYRTEADCRDLAHSGSRVRLVKGAYAEPPSVAYPAKSDVDLAYVRCLKILMAGDGYPMVASHDPRMIELAGVLAERNGRASGSYEYQMLHGIRTGEQRRLAAAGERVRVYVPYGADWYGYFMRRLAERPANVGFFLRSLFTR